MLEKQQPIVALDLIHKSLKRHVHHAIKKNNLEPNLYSSLDPDILNKILSKVLS